MKSKLHILGASGRLDSMKDEIEKSCNEVLAIVEIKISVSSVDIIIADNASDAIPETGVGGYAPNANLLHINIDPESPGLRDRLGSEIKSTLTHELHHCARWAAVGYGTTLLEAVVSEGLADHFDIEINGGEPKPWSTALSSNELQVQSARAQLEFLNPTYDHGAWFFGSEKEGIPRWTGYSIGYSLVDTYMKSSGKTASSLVGVPAKSIILD